MLSIAGGALFFWLASKRLTLWPDALEVHRTTPLWVAIGLYVPYALIRAMRLAYVFDPLVERASGGEQVRVDRRVLYGSGLVSFLVLLVLPFKLGELSRPILLARGRQPGIGMAEAVTGVAMERVVDGLVICSMLFGGLAMSAPQAAAGDLADVRHVGRLLSLLFVAALIFIVWAARSPDRAAGLARFVVRPLGDRAAERAAALCARLGASVRGVLSLRRALPFLLSSVAYWGVTVAQLWLVLQACGIDLGPGESAAIVAVVGLGIQLPGGPLQAGTYHAATAVGLGLFLSEPVVAGAGSTFAAIMYVLQNAGAAALAVPGLVLLGWWRREAP